MSLAPIVSSPPGGDHQVHHQQPISVLSPVESFEDHENQSEMATVPRALALNDDDVLSCSSLHSSRVTAIDTNSSITSMTPTAPAGSGSPTSHAAATPTPTRPTGRVVLQALETSPNGAATSVHLGGAAAGGVCSNFDSDSNSKLLSPSRLPPSKPAEEEFDACEVDAQLSLHGSTGRTGEARGAALNNATDPNRSDVGRGGIDDESSPESLVLPTPLTVCVSAGNLGASADPAELSPDASAKLRNSTTGAGGRPTIIRSPSGGAESAPRRGFVAGLSSIPSFFQRNGSTASLWGASDNREQSSKKWSMLYSARSGKTMDYEDETLGLHPDGHDSERARKHWRVLRAVFMALGKATKASV